MIDRFFYFCDWIFFLVISLFWLFLIVCFIFFVWLISEFNVDFFLDNLFFVFLIRVFNCVISSLFIFMADLRLCREFFFLRNISLFLRFVVLILFCNRSIFFKRVRFDFFAIFNLIFSCRIRLLVFRLRFGLYLVGFCFRLFIGIRFLFGGRGELMLGR